MTTNTQTPKLQEEIQQFLQANPGINEVDLMSMDICGHFFGKRYPIAQLEKLATTGVKLPRAMPLMSAIGEPLRVGKYGLDDGDPDDTFYLVPGSLSRIPWDKNPRAQMLVSTVDSQCPLFFEPRALLARVLELFHSRDYFPTVAFELEFYLIDAQRTEQGMIQPARLPNSSTRDTSALLRLDRISGFSDCLTDIIESCHAQGIETGPLSAELGHGQYELNLEHQRDAMLAADQCAAFRRTVQSVALKHGLQATFMAKPYLEQAGNGQHLHLSLYDRDGQNVLEADQDRLLLNAVAGCLELLPASMAILAPNSNAYRRYESGNCVAVNTSWGYDNRTTAIRVPDSDSKNRRLEHRVAGADSNPYLTLACILAGIFYGLDEALEPWPPEEGNACDPQGLPSHLRDALQRFQQSEPLRQLLGEQFVNVYCQQKLGELNAFERKISAREYEWYL